MTFCEIWTMTCNLMCPMKNTLSKRTSYSLKPILFALLVSVFFTSEGTTHNVNSNSNISAFNPSINNNDTIRITATLSINQNTTYTQANLTILIDSGILLWSGNNELTLSSTSQVVTINGGTLSVANPCNAVKVLTIGTTSATCNGGGGVSYSFTNINSIGGFNQSGTFDPFVALPVTLLSFDALNSNNKVALTWITAQEVNNSHFVITKSIDGNNWETIATVEGMGNTFENTTYSYFDKSPSKVNYYKLVQVDFDGSETNLGIRFVLSNPTITKVEPVLFPNPVQNVLNIKFENNGVSTATIEVMDMSGKVISTQNNEISEVQTVQIFTENLSTGIYTVRITLNNQTTVKRIVKR